MAQQAQTKRYMKIIRAADQQFVPASHEDPDKPGVLRRAIASKSELLAGRVQMINWAKLPIGSAFRAHYHEDMEETFVIINGNVEMIVDGKGELLGPGDAILIQPGEVHVMKNLSEHEVDYMVVGISKEENGKTIVVGA